LLVPTARFVPGLQVSVVLIAALFVFMCRTLMREEIPLPVAFDSERRRRRAHDHDND
jgi:hypothetical protein